MAPVPADPRTLYEILGVTATAPLAEIRQAYIRESLRYHPDKNPADDAKIRFQEVANAYYILSDKERRDKYDTKLAASGATASTETDTPVNPYTIFGQVFDDLLIPEVPNPSYFWQPIGTLSGSALGFIILNIPGALIGGYYGNRMGKVRDMKGVSVYEAFSKLSTEKRKQVLSNLAKRFFTAAVAHQAKA